VAKIATHLRALRDTPQTVDLREPLLKVLVPDPPPAKLTLEPSNSTELAYTRLTWTGAMSDREEQELRKWHARVPPLPPGAREILARAVHTLIDKLNTDGNITEPIHPPPRRPTRAELDADPLLQGQLKIEADKVTWTGRLRSAEQIEHLRNLPMAGDPSFQQAVAEIIAEIEGQREVLAFTEKIPLRPMTADLPERLRPRLLIGREVMHYHGIMPEAEARGYYDQAQPVDQKAIARLYRQTVRRGLRDNGLKIAARRGTADASEMRTIEIGSLERSQE
jgi:hypothetical protein